MAAIPHRRRAVIVFFAWTALACCAQTEGGNFTCPVTIESLKDATPFSVLEQAKQAQVLRALRDDIAEMAEIDEAGSSASRSAYRDYFIHRLQYKYVLGTTPEEQLLLVRYNSNTVCGQHDNCPVWIIRFMRNGAQSMVPWQDEHLGTSAGGGWGVGLRPRTGSEYPDLILLTHLSSSQTGLACYRESKGKYLRVDCPPECAQPSGGSNGPH